MPFSKYFQDDLPPADGHAASALQFQLPAFIHSGAPTLAQGGGAEVLTFNPAWFANPSTGYCPPYAPHFRDPPDLTRRRPSVCAPSPLGLPVYSASGFDVLSILARVASRPNARIVLGPVDMTCSFVVVDVRRHDQPIVYCSPTFCRLTGYPEHEVLGRNCRFLQAPPSSGPVRAGESRRFTSQASVDTMRKALIANKEVQTSIVNFRKDGSAFINLVSVVPVLGGERGAAHELNDVVYHVGFQVDLTEQPKAILDKLRDGSYTQNTLPLGPAAPYTESHHDIPPPPPQRKQQLPPILMAPSLAQALANPALHRDLPITTSTTAPSPLPPASTTSAASVVSGTAINNPLSLILLEYAPDFILVVSLKGAFLYVAPAIFHVLGHSPAALVGRSISDLAHPEDVVPLERQLKESSTLVNVAVPSSPGSHNELSHHSHQQHAKLIDVLFRARTAGGSYVWVEARGRLHVEPGKGRKAIVLSARARRMPQVRWGDLLPPLRVSGDGADTTRECWAQLSGLGKAAGAIVSIGNGVEDVFGCRAGDILGRRISMLVVEEDRESVEGILRGIEGCGEARVVLFVRVRTGTEKEVVRVRLVFYPSHADGEDGEGLCIAPPTVLLHIARGEGIDNLSIVEEQHLHDPEENVFAELDVRRGSSWQYELQQLRFRNMRLREEVKALEKEVKAYEGQEGTPGEVVEPLMGSKNEGNATTIAGNSYPPPQYESLDINVSASRADQDAYRYDAQHETEQHVNYTTALERYTSDGGAVYEGLELALGMGMGMGMDVGLETEMVGMGMDASVSAYGLAQNHPEHRSSFHVPHGHHQHTQHAQHGRLTGQAHMQAQTQAQTHTHTQAQTQSGMYAPQPIHSHAHSPSGLLHALGAPSHHRRSHSQHHQHQEIQRPGGAHVNRVQAYDFRSQGLAHHPSSVRGDEDLGRKRQESQWGSGTMHPGVKRSFGQ
ncbi:hypothetical protein C0993_006021 [Termitomyces sp. T159_Od127]|nr:hypothetical protein C0993_006021 [Termitomyces sp. T159_Od127]